ncbi:MAG: hypothetical protein QXT86_10820 [Archaeoglobaceae archaeon]
MSVILFRHKKRGLSFTYDFETKTFRFKDYVSNVEKVLTLEEVLSFFWKEEELVPEERDLEKRLEKVSALIYLKGKLVPLNPKGLEKFIDIALLRVNVKEVPKEVKEELKAKLLNRLYKDFFLKKAIPTTATIKELANQLVEQKFKLSFEELRNFLITQTSSFPENFSQSPSSY